MSGCSEDGASGNNNDLEAFSNKKDSEKKRREQENFYIEELAMLISSQIPDISDSEDSSGIFDSSKLEKGSILQVRNVNFFQFLQQRINVSSFVGHSR